MDISTLKMEATAEIEIENPRDGKLTGIKIQIVSSDSDTANRLRRAQQNRRLTKLSRGGSRRQVLTAEELDEEGLEFIAGCVTGWSGLVENGQPVAFSSTTALRLLTAYPWLREQVDRAIADRANFFAQPVKPS